MTPGSPTGAPKTAKARGLDWPRSHLYLKEQAGNLGDPSPALLWQNPSSSLLLLLRWVWCPEELQWVQARNIVHLQNSTSSWAAPTQVRLGLRRC